MLCLGDHIGWLIETENQRGLTKFDLKLHVRRTRLSQKFPHILQRPFYVKRTTKVTFNKRCSVNLR